MNGEPTHGIDPIALDAARDAAFRYPRIPDYFDGWRDALEFVALTGYEPTAPPASSHMTFDL